MTIISTLLFKQLLCHLCSIINGVCLSKKASEYRRLLRSEYSSLCEISCGNVVSYICCFHFMDILVYYSVFSVLKMAIE